MKLTCLTFIALLFFLSVNAQTQRADRLFKKWDYYRAAKLYEKESEKNPSAEIYYKLGECYRIMKQYKKEEQDAYDKVNDYGIFNKPEFYLNYGLVLRANGNFYQANEAFKKYSELVPMDQRGAYFGNAIEIAIDDQQWDEPITISNVRSLNSIDADFSPVFYMDGIVFTSSRKNFGYNDVYGWTGANYLEMYYAKKGSNNLDFTDVVPLLNKNGDYHEGPSYFSANYDTIYISRAEKYSKVFQRKPSSIEQNKIFTMIKKNDRWTDLEPFAFNSETYSIAIPFLVPDGSRLYFASNMPGGYGETDLYYCIREGNKWGTPINMGPNVNTFNREKYPYIDKNGNFYFSSDGYQGYGGLDICVALNNNGTLDKAKPLKYPFNSYTDDTGIIFIEDGKTGYLTSNRKESGLGDDDILYFDLERDKLETSLVASMYTIGYRPKPNSTEILFKVDSPKNIPVERKVRESLPLRNYVFFDLESTEIPDRYVLLTKDQVIDFKEDQLDGFASKRRSGRSERQMTAYYNILNIVGDRLGKNPSSSITLVGSSEKGPEDGEAMAGSIKQYLINVFQINGSRINIEGRHKPLLSSEQPGGQLELELLREGDRRVTIESHSPALLMEYQNGTNAPLKSVEISDVQKAPLDSYISFMVFDPNAELTSWLLEITDETGMAQHFGPFTVKKVSKPGKQLLGDRQSGEFRVSMIGQTKNGDTVQKDTTIQIVLWSQKENIEGMRFSVLFEFNDSKSISIYEKYLTNVVTPKIPVNGTLIIQGYSDIIGNEENNQKLSLTRAIDVSGIFRRALSNVGRDDVKIKVFGFGEDESLSPFENNLPEERFYNRTVIIDIIP